MMNSSEKREKSESRNERQNDGQKIPYNIKSSFNSPDMPYIKNPNSRGEETLMDPYFQYICSDQSTILDTQYSTNGQFLASVTSNGSMYIYKGQIQEEVESPESGAIAQFHLSNKNNSLLKVAWKYCEDVIAVSTIDKDIFILSLVKNIQPKSSSSSSYSLKIKAEKKFQNIATHLAWFPSQDIFVNLTVGFSSGKLALLNQQLKTIWEKVAHQQSINWIAWEPNFSINTSTEWIVNYFPNHFNNSKYKKYLLATGSSDNDVKIWCIGEKAKKYKEEDDKNFVANYYLQEKLKISAHKKQIRQVSWKPHHFFQANQNCRYLVTCSEDYFVRFWEISITPQGKAHFTEKSSKAMDGPVYRAEFNSIGTMIAISYEASNQQLKTEIKKDQFFGLKPK